MAALSAEVVEFLSAGTRTGMLGYVAADGRPLVAPIWFVVDDGELAFNTGRGTAKARAIARDSRVVICVDDPHQPYSFVQVQGVAAVSEDPPRCWTSPPGPARGTWAPTGPTSSAGVTPSPASWWCGFGRRR